MEATAGADSRLGTLDRQMTEAPDQVRERLLKAYNGEIVAGAVYELIARRMPDPRGRDPSADGRGRVRTSPPARAADARARDRGSRPEHGAGAAVVATAGADRARRPAAGRPRGRRGRRGRRPVPPLDRGRRDRRAAARHPPRRAVARAGRAETSRGGSGARGLAGRRPADRGPRRPGPAGPDPRAREVAPHRRRLDLGRDLRRQRRSRRGVRNRRRRLGRDRRLELGADRRPGGGDRLGAVDGHRRVPGRALRTRGRGGQRRARAPGDRRRIPRRRRRSCRSSTSSRASTRTPPTDSRRRMSEHPDAMLQTLVGRGVRRDLRRRR